MPTARGVRGQFPSSQEYDLRLRNAAGDVVWTWSATRLFAAMLHERTFSGTWTESLAVPFLVVQAEGTRAFTLEAWLTGGYGEPRFAAAVPVEVPVVLPAAN